MLDGIKNNLEQAKTGFEKIKGKYVSVEQISDDEMLRENRAFSTEFFEHPSYKNAWNKTFDSFMPKEPEPNKLTAKQKKFKEYILAYNKKNADEVTISFHVIPITLQNPDNSMTDKKILNSYKDKTKVIKIINNTVNSDGTHNTIYNIF